MDKQREWSRFPTLTPINYEKRLLILVAFCSLMAVGGRSLFAPLLPTIIDDLGISPSEAGLALSVMTALSAICRYPGGRFADQLSRKTVLVVALGLMTVGFAIFTGVTDYTTFVFGAVVVGIGAGLYLPSAFALLSDLFVEKRGQAIGTNNAAVNLGGILAAGSAVVVLARGSWQLAFLPVVVLFAVLLVFMHRLNTEPYVIDRVSLNVRSTVSRLLTRPRIRWMTVSAILVMFTQRGALAFIPLFFEVEKGFSTVLATASFAGYFLVGMLFTPVAGWLGDRIGHIYTVLGATVVASGGLTIILLTTYPPATISGVALFALGVGGFWPSMNAYVLTLFPDDSLAGDFGALGTIYLGVGSLGPTYLGFVAEQASYQLAFTGLVLCLLGSSCINFLLSRF